MAYPAHVPYSSTYATNYHDVLFSSNRWSFAVVIWEIASYGKKISGGCCTSAMESLFSSGARPFSEHKVGVSLSRFIGLLQAGHRLPQPEGLSDSL